MSKCHIVGMSRLIYLFSFSDKTFPNMFSSLFNSFTRLLKNRRDQPISVDRVGTNNAESINNSKEPQKVAWDVKSRKRTSIVNDVESRMEDIDVNEPRYDVTIYKENNPAKKRQRNPTFYAQRWENCISLPNIFRTSSIQDKSMKISRKRRKYGRYQRKIEHKCNRNDTDGTDDEEILSATEASIHSLNNGPDDKDQLTHRLVWISNMDSTMDMSWDMLVNEDIGIQGENRYDSVDSVYHQSTSSSDEYLSCEEDLTDYNENFITDDDNNESPHKALNRISSIQKRSWTIRQRRKENIYKRRSMDISVLIQR